MTGYGAAAAETEALRAAVSVRSVNHRFLDVVLHLSRSVAPLEADIKALIQSTVARGRVEVSVHAVLRDEQAEVGVASRRLVASLVRTLRELQTEFGLEGGVRAADIARFPGILEVIEAPSDVGATARQELLGVVGRALDALEEMRRAEGKRLAADLRACLASVAEAAGRIEALSESGKAGRRQALTEKARGLVADLGLEEARLYQEVVRFVDRHDVSEELQRLKSHVSQARDLIDAEAPSGKRLDFLAQELLREANTVGSKAASAEVIHEVVRLKGEIERLREQVQNVE